MIYGSTIGVVLALAATTASAGRRSYEEIVASLSDGGPRGSYEITYGSSSEHYGGSIRCSSEAWAQSYSKFKSSYISAVEDVVADVCDPEWDGSAIYAAEVLRDWASAYATAAAATTARCSSSVHGGAKARGCAYSEADSSAAARAYATVHAEASAEAFAKHCNCANADAWSFGNADLFLELWASAYAEASTTACASGNKDSEASAYVKCYADIMAETIAFAAGTAAADAGCYAGYQDVNARTDIEAIVDGYVHNYDSCKIVKQADGLGDANADGGSDTGSKTN